MPVTVQCEVCSAQTSVRPARAKTYRFCSYRCRSTWRKGSFTGANNPNWKGGYGETRICQECGDEYGPRPEQPKTTFIKQKFCSKECADKGGFRFSGSDHPNYKENARRRNRPHGHAKWAQAVLSRDNATCQECGATGVEMHAHHIKPYAEYPELASDVSNGITLCFSCHWAVHSALDANGVNSGNILPGKAGDNPEPSLSRKVLEGVTTRKRAYRRIEGPCEVCGTFVSKRASNVKPWRAFTCGRKCGSVASVRKRYGSNLPTSALPERDDIV